jgi:hypothetical protein
MGDWVGISTWCGKADVTCQGALTNESASFRLARFKHLLT